MNDCCYVPDATQALSDLSELIRSLDGLVELRRLVDEGTPLLRAYIDRPSASEAGDIIARYELCEPLKVFLTTMRARHGQSDEIECARHDGSPLDSRQIQSQDSTIGELRGRRS
jgi:hypothetical protein